MRKWLGNISLLAVASLLLLPFVGYWQDIDTAVRAGCVWTDYGSGDSYRFHRLFRTEEADTSPAALAAAGANDVRCYAPALAGVVTSAWTADGTDGPTLTIDAQGIVERGKWEDAPSDILVMLLLPVITIAAIASAGAMLIIIFVI